MKMRKLGFAFAVLSGLSFLYYTFPDVRTLTANEMRMTIGGDPSGPTMIGPVPQWICGPARNNCTALRWHTACGSEAAPSAITCAAAGDCFYCNAGQTYLICVFTGNPQDNCDANSVVPNSCGGVLMLRACKFTPAGGGNPAKCSCPAKGDLTYKPQPGTCDKSDCI